LKPIQRSYLSKKFATEKVLREVLRHYIEFRQLVQNGGDHVIEHSYEVKDETGKVTKHTIAFSFWDLHRGIKELAPRKREALFWHVIMDYTQRDAGAKMHIGGSSVVQYVDSACKELLKHHFNFEELNND